MSYFQSGSDKQNLSAMSTGAKILVFIGAMFFITIIKGMAPNLVIPATMLGGFIAMKLFFSKNDSSKKESHKPTNQEVKNLASNTDESPTQSIDSITEKPVEEVLPEVEVAIPTSSDEQKVGAKTEINQNRKLIAWHSWKFEKGLTHSQKIIFSLSVFSILLIICYAFAESLDSKMRMKETWFVWVGFILSQAWFQNKFWNNTGSNFQITLKRPELSGLKEIWFIHKHKILIVIGAVIIVSIIGLSIEPLNNYFEQQEIRRKELARSRHEDSVTTALSREREYKTHLKTSEDTYDLTIALKAIDANTLSIKIKAENSELLDKTGKPALLLLMQPSKTMEDLYAEHLRFSQTFYTDYNLTFHTPNGTIGFHVSSESMHYEGDFEHPVYLNGKRIDIFSDNWVNVYHTFITEQMANIEGRRETFLEIDSITAVYN